MKGLVMARVRPQVGRHIRNESNKNVTVDVA